MKKLQSWVDHFAIHYPGVRPIYVMQMRAMLVELLMEFAEKAAKNAVAADSTKGCHTLAMQQVLKEIEELK